MVFEICFAKLFLVFLSMEPNNSSEEGDGDISPSMASAPGGSVSRGFSGLLPHPSRYMDTSLTKVFVGGLAWQTKGSVLHEHFSQYGAYAGSVFECDV